MDLLTLGTAVLPSLIGLVGGGKGGNKPKDVEMKTPPTTAPEQEAQFAQFNDLLTQILSDPTYSSRRKTTRRWTTARRTLTRRGSRRAPT
jgi:hypothetical protein